MLVPPAVPSRVIVTWLVAAFPGAVPRAIPGSLPIVLAGVEGALPALTLLSVLAPVVIVAAALVVLLPRRSRLTRGPLVLGSWRRCRRRDLEAGQTTAEYALVLLGAATVALLVLAWATRTGKVGQLLNAVVDSIIAKV